MKVYSLILLLVLVSGCCSSTIISMNPVYENPYQEINAYFEKMGLTPKGDQKRPLNGTKREILVGLEDIYHKWDLEINIDSPITEEMTVCDQGIGSEKWLCKTWVW